MVVEAHARGGELGSALHQSYLDRGFTLVRMNNNPAGPDVVHDNTTNNRELPPFDGFTGDRQ